jgi:hypothetical protein
MKVVLSIIVSLMMFSACTTVAIVKTTPNGKVPPGQQKQAAANPNGKVPPGQQKQATGSQSAKPYAPGQQKQNNNPSANAPGQQKQKKK